MRQPISDAEFQVMLTDQIARLDDLTRPTWKQHRIKPERYPSTKGSSGVLVVARAGDEVVYFDDSDDQFARGEVNSDGAIQPIDTWGFDLGRVLRHFPRKKARPMTGE